MNSTNTDNNSKYTIDCLKLTNVNIHTFKGLEPIPVNSFIIETSHNLVIIDTQLTLENAGFFKDYAISLNKPIARVIVTHAHYDHFAVLPVFDHDVTYALKETIADIKSAGVANKTELAKNALPCHNLENSFILDGLTYECSNFKNAHCPNHLVIYIKEINTLILGDLAQNNTHVLVMNFNGSLKVLQTLKTTYSNAKYLLTGHSLIGDITILDNSLKYVKKCQEIYQDITDHKNYEAAVIKAFPNVIKLATVPLYILFEESNPNTPLENLL